MNVTQLKVELDREAQAQEEGGAEWLAAKAKRVVIQAPNGKQYSVHSVVVRADRVVISALRPED